MRLERNRRRARKYGCIIKPITREDTEKLLSLQENKCNECSTDISDREKRHLDHIKPFSL
jgi:hypothetical protein